MVQPLDLCASFALALDQSFMCRRGIQLHHDKFVEKDLSCWLSHFETVMQEGLAIEAPAGVIWLPYCTHFTVVVHEKRDDGSQSGR